MSEGASQLAIFPPAVARVFPLEGHLLSGQANPASLAARKKLIEDALAAAAMPVLAHAEAIREWIDISDALVAVYAQPEQKPKGGRPRGGVAEAARRPAR